MSRFLRHERCPSCGSRDNLGRYEDGSAWCFGCHYREGRSGNSVVFKPQVDTDEVKTYPKIPEDAGTYFEPEAVAWLQQYGVGVVEAVQRGLLWSPSRKQLIFNMGEIWQARNFRDTFVSSDGSTKKSGKYFTSGNVQDVLPIYPFYNETTETLVVVEDCVSALKIARQCDAMPVLGSYLCRTKLNRIARLYSSLIVWLDHDKYKEAVEIAETAKLVGLKTRVLYTEEDPKCYNDTQITEVITK